MKPNASLSEYGQKTLSFRPRATPKKKRIETPQPKKRISQKAAAKLKLPAALPGDVLLMLRELRAMPDTAAQDEYIGISLLALPAEVRTRPANAHLRALRLLDFCVAHPSHPSIDKILQSCCDILPAVTFNSGTQGHRLLLAIAKAADRQPGFFDDLQGIAKIKNRNYGFMIGGAINIETSFALARGSLLFVEGNERFKSADDMLRSREYLGGYKILPEVVRALFYSFSGRHQPQPGSLSKRTARHYTHFTEQAREMTQKKTMRALQPIGAVMLEKLRAGRVPTAPQPAP